MRRRDFLVNAAVAGAALTAPGSAPVAGQSAGQKTAGAAPAAGDRMRLAPPREGRIPVAFLISRGVTVIDFAGPWEVFQDVMIGAGADHRMPFELYTVSDTLEPVIATAGLKLIPNHTYETAPAPRVVVVPAQGGRSPAMFDWLRRVSRTADVTMSVCTGAFVLASAGLLAGKAATTHHDFADRLAREFPDVDVKRGLRFVEGPKISTAGGLTSGIDLALRAVERYFGREVAQATAVYMEYQSKGWIS